MRLLVDLSGQSNAEMVGTGQNLAQHEFIYGSEDGAEYAEDLIAASQGRGQDRAVHADVVG